MTVEVLKTSVVVVGEGTEEMIILLGRVARFVVMLSMQEVWVLICVVLIGDGTGEMTVAMGLVDRT
jgi:hypothetical protein